MHSLLKLFVFLVFSPCLVYGDNLIFNGSFELGTEGFGNLRTLRPDTNPDLKFRHPQVEKKRHANGKPVLKIDNEAAECWALHSRDFRLEAGKTYTFSANLKSSTPDYPLVVLVYSVDIQNKWRLHNQAFRLQTDWRRYEWTFTAGHTEIYHLQIRGQERVFLKAATLEVNDLRLIEKNSAVPDRLIGAIVPEKLLCEYPAERAATVELKLHNPLRSTINDMVTVVAADDYTGEERFRAELPFSLPARETKTLKFDLPLTHYGTMRITGGTKGRSDILEHYVSVIGKYEQKPVDFGKDFVVSLNTGMFYMFNESRNDTYDGKRLTPGYFSFGPIDERLSMISRMGCRLLRDHDAGIPAQTWRTIEPEKGKWDFSGVDRMLRYYEKHGLTQLPIMGSVHFIKRAESGSLWPEWVEKRSERVQNDPPNVMTEVRGRIFLPPLPEWREYNRRYAERVKGKIRYFEIVNEPNLFLGPEVYVRYLKTAAEAIRSEIPDAKIVGFCVTTDQGALAIPWAKAASDAGGLDYADILSFHPYGSRELGSIHPADKDIADIRAFLAPRKKLPIWNSELYYTFDMQEAFNGSYYPQADAQAHHIARRFLTDLGEGVGQSVAVTESCIWKERLCPGQKSPWQNLYEFVPSSNFVAYNALARHFEGAQPVKKIRHPNGIICYAFRKEGKPVATVWNYDDTSGVFADFSGFEVLDLFGNSRKAEELKLSQAPWILKPGALSEAEFLRKLETLKLRLDQAIAVTPIVRLAGDAALIAIRNTGKTVSRGTVGFSGENVVAKKPVTFELAAGEAKLLSVPIAKSASNQDPRVMLYTDGRMIRIPVETVQIPVLAPNKSLLLKSGDANFQAALKLAVADGKLSLEFDVKDDSDSGETGERDKWKTDSIELFFDLSPDDLPVRHAKEYTPDVFRVFITPRDTPDKRLTLWCDDKKLSPEDLKLELKTTSDAYLGRLEIPLHRFKVGERIGFDVKVNNFDGGGAQRAVSWTKADDRFQNRCVFGILQLVQSQQ